MPVEPGATTAGHGDSIRVITEMIAAALKIYPGTNNSIQSRHLRSENNSPLPLPVLYTHKILVISFTND